METQLHPILATWPWQVTSALHVLLLIYKLGIITIYMSQEKHKHKLEPLYYSKHYVWKHLVIVSNGTRKGHREESGRGEKFKTKWRDETSLSGVAT